MISSTSGDPSWRHTGPTGGTGLRFSGQSRLRQNRSVCGRIGFSADREQLLGSYLWLRDAPSLPPRFNIAPTDETVVVSRSGAELMPWGIGGGTKPVFNVRGESALQPGRYRRLLLEARAVMPASHFYEWHRVGSRRQPMAIARRDGSLLNIAALVGTRWNHPAVTMLTTTPNRDLESLHDRMPVLLSDDDAATWALEELGDEQLRELLRPYADGLLAIRPASPLVNDVRNDGPELLNPNALPPTYQLDLPNPS